MPGADDAARCFHCNDPVLLIYFLDRAVAEEPDAVCAASLRYAGKVFEGMEGRLPRIA
jgi:hypothetical protein